MQVTRTSSLSGKVFTMELNVTQEQLDRFEKRRENGEYVQTIFPHLTSEEREFILTGISPAEWNNIFGND